MALSESPTAGWTGRYNDGRTARSEAVTARLTSGGIEFAQDDEALRGLWPFDTIRLLEPLDRTGPLRLARFGSGERLTLDSADSLAALERLCPKLRHSAETEPPWRIIAIWSGAAIAAVALLVFAVIPFVAGHAGQWVSPRLEAALGDHVADAIIAITVRVGNTAHRECAAPAGRAALDALVAPLAAQAKLRSPPRLRVVNGTMVNAFALPGGQILIYRGLLDFAQDPNELAGVIAHELGHLALDHPTALVIRQSATAFLIGLLLGDVLGGSAVGIAATTLVDSSFSREAESAADRDAVAFMGAAGFNVGPFGAFFTRLEKEHPSGSGVIGFLDGHPPNDERARLAAREGGQPALGAARWAALKKICE